DGIRDKLVTGVQTCALPICSTLMTSAPKSPKICPQKGPAKTREASSTRMPANGPGAGCIMRFSRPFQQMQWTADVPKQTLREAEIGRASCRERVKSMEVAVV